MKKTVSFILSVVIILTQLSGVAAFAAAPEGSGAAVWIEDVTVTAGNSFTLTVKGRGLDKISTLSFAIYYDANYFQFSSVSPQSMITSDSGNINSSNTATPGKVGLDLISANGISGDGNLWRVTFRALSTAPAGKYSFTLAVGEVFNSSLAPITLASGNASVTVNAVAQSIKNVYFYATRTVSSLKIGESSSVTFYSSNMNGLATADFEIEYDHSLLKLDSVELGSKMTSAQNAVYSINSNSPGYVKISYAAPGGLTGSVNPTVKLKFTAVANVDAAATVKLKVGNMYGSDLNVMQASAVSTTLSIVKSEEKPILPKLFFNNYEDADGEFYIDLTAPVETGLAAADFTLNFDPTMLSCLSVERGAEDQMVISNIDNENGLVKFSFIDENGIKEDTVIARVKFSTEGLKGGATVVTFSGKNLVDADFNAVQAEFVGASLVLHKHGKAATCTEDEVCSVPGCGKILAERLGHDKVYHDAQAPDCTEIGWNAYETCSRCDYTTYSEIPANGHSYSSEETETHMIYTCSACGDSYSVEIVHDPVSVTNTDILTAWGLDFTTSVNATSPIEAGNKFKLYFAPDVAELLDIGSSESVVAELSGDGELTVKILSDISAGEKLLDLTFKTSELLGAGEYGLLSIEEKSSETSSFTGLRIYEMGDINLDGKVNSRDVTMIRQYVVKMADLTAVQKAYGNVYVDEDKNGQPLISSRDAVLIQQYVVKMDVELGDRVDVTFVYGESEKVYSVRKGSDMSNIIPEAPEGYAWSASADEYVAPDLSEIIESQKYYLIRQESVYNEI